MMEEILVDCDSLPWTPIVPGIDFRLLFTSVETGRWTVMFRCQAGSFSHATSIMAQASIS